jgi:hypothetical protein
MLFVIFTCTPTHVAARFLAGVLEISVHVCVCVPLAPIPEMNEILMAQ